MLLRARQAAVRARRNEICRAARAQLLTADWELQFAPMDGADRNRIRLWLRSEKAMGLPSVIAAVSAEVVEEIVSSDECAVEDCGAATRSAPEPAAPVVLPAATGGGRPYGSTDLFAPAASQPQFGATPLA